MAGKRISREIKTIDKMIQIYQKSHPAPEEDPEYYQKIFKSVVMVNQNPHVNNALFIATNLKCVMR